MRPLLALGAPVVCVASGGGGPRLGCLQHRSTPRLPLTHFCCTCPRALPPCHLPAHLQLCLLDHKENFA